MFSPLCAGLLVELDALASVLEGNVEWRPDAVAVRARMLRILSRVAARYLSSGLLPGSASAQGSHAAAS